MIIISGIIHQEIGIINLIIFDIYQQEKDWENAIASFQQNISDDVIHKAVMKLPPEIYAIDGLSIEEKLKSRKHLPFVAGQAPAHRVEHGREIRMSKSKHTLFEAVLARMSLGAVPMDGVYWFDPKVMRERAAEAAERAKSAQGANGQEKSLEHCNH